MSADEASLISEIIETHTATMRERYTDSLELLLDDCGSPIEKVFGAALLHDLYACEYFDFHFVEGQTWPEDRFNSNMIFSQYKIGRYIADFFVYYHNHDRASIKIAIECDGHDFHERTKEQARRDRSKDRWLLCNGYMVLRFTGSEIWKDPIGCAAQVHNLLLSRIIR